MRGRRACAVDALLVRARQPLHLKYGEEQSGSIWKRNKHLLRGSDTQARGMRSPSGRAWLPDGRGLAGGKVHVHACSRLLSSAWPAAAAPGTAPPGLLPLVSGLKVQSSSSWRSQRTMSRLDGLYLVLRDRQKPAVHVRNP